MTLMVRNVHIQICAAESFEFCKAGSASMLKNAIRLLLIRIGWFIYSINVAISQHNIYSSRTRLHVRPQKDSCLQA